METVADQDERCGSGIPGLPMIVSVTSVTMIVMRHVRHMSFAHFLVAVTPENEFLEHEEEQQAGQQRDADPVNRFDTDTFDRMRQQAEQRRSEQCAGGEAHEVRQYAHAHRCRRQ